MSKRKSRKKSEPKKQQSFETKVEPKAEVSRPMEPGRISLRTPPPVKDCVACKILGKDFEPEQLCYSDDRAIVLHLDGKVIGLSRIHASGVAGCPDDDGSPVTVEEYVYRKARWWAEVRVFPGQEILESVGSPEHYIVEFGAK